MTVQLDIFFVLVYYYISYHLLYFTALLLWFLLDVQCFHSGGWSLFSDRNRMNCIKNNLVINVNIFWHNNCSVNAVLIYLNCL